MSGSYAFTITIMRYPLNEDGSRGTGVQILQVYEDDTQYFDMLIDNPGPGNWVYTQEFSTTLGADGILTRRTIVALVTKR